MGRGLPGHMENWRHRGYLRIAAFLCLRLCLPGQVWSPASAPLQSPPVEPRHTERRAGKKQPPEPTFVLVGAGDIASCQYPEGAQATAKLIDKIPGTVFAAGDLAYESGSAAEFENCYAPAWGRFKSRTRPALGNHEYVEPTARGYFEYWGLQAGPRGKGYYSFELGSWHVVALNTNCYARELGG